MLIAAWPTDFHRNNFEADSRSTAHYSSCWNWISGCSKGTWFGNQERVGLSNCCGCSTNWGLVLNNWLLIDTILFCCRLFVLFTIHMVKKGMVLLSTSWLTTRKSLWTWSWKVPMCKTATTQFLLLYSSQSILIRCILKNLTLPNCMRSRTSIAL